MSEQSIVKEVLIQGVTHDGRPFRPSDWAERLCGVLSAFRPPGTGGVNAYFGFSPYVRPTMIDGVKAVILDERLRALEPRAYDFVISFARDNGLVTADICVLPEPSEKP